MLPATAGAKLDFLLVPDQHPQAILALLERHLREQGFGDIEVHLLEAPSRPAQSTLQTLLVAVLVRSVQYVYGIEPHVLPRRPGSGRWRNSASATGC